MAMNGLLAEKHVLLKGGRQVVTRICPGPQHREVVQGKRQVEMPFTTTSRSPLPGSQPISSQLSESSADIENSLSGKQRQLYDALFDLRMELGQQHGISFHDVMKKSSLIETILKLPSTVEEFSQIEGLPARQVAMLTPTFFPAVQCWAAELGR
jgi:superfamily II DNA helicase RecQ